MPSFDELYTRLIDTEECVNIEAKKSSEIGESALQTICAFANEPASGGGHLLLGITTHRTAGGPMYTVTGVPDPDKLQADLANQCVNVFNVPIRPLLSVETVFGDKRVVIATIQEADAKDKPVFFKKAGLPKGAFRRIGSADHRCNEDDLALLFQLREHGGYDNAVVSGATMEDIDSGAVKEYRTARADLNRSAEELKLNNRDLLISLGAAVVREGTIRITWAGLLLFGKTKALRRLCPWARVDYVIVPGQEWVPDAANRYRTVESRQPLLTAIPRIVDLVVQDLPRTFQLKGKRTRRKEIPTIPHTVIREAIVNAVMHRNYRTHKPVQIIKFSNRLEIRNPGYSLVAPEHLGEPGSETRNPSLAAVLHETGYAETKGTGISTMRRQMHASNLTAPLFKSSKEHDQFEVTLLTHHLVDASTVEWLSHFADFALDEHEAKAVVIVREIGYITNAVFRDLNDVETLVASKALKRLRELGLLEAHGKGSATFYRGTSLLLQPEIGSLGLNGPLTPRYGVATKPRTGPVALNMSADLIDLLRRIGERSTDSELVRIAVLRLCAIQPLPIGELARYLQREPPFLQRTYIRPMLKEGSLRFRFPDAPGHPRQAYITAPFLANIPIPIGEVKKRRTKKDDPQTTLF
jgi:ATP-dependent DNA helicase RecG